MSQDAIPIMETAYDASRAEADLAYIVQQRKIIDWWTMQIALANEKIEAAEMRLTVFGVSYRQTVGNSRVSLSNGSIVVTKAREKTEIYDREAWSAWLDRRRWAEHFFDKKINESMVKQALFPSEDGSLFLPSSDEPVPGIRRVIPGPQDYSVKINAGRNIPEETSDGEGAD